MALHNPSDLHLPANFFGITPLCKCEKIGVIIKKKQGNKEKEEDEEQKEKEVGGEKKNENDSNIDSNTDNKSDRKNELVGALSPVNHKGLHEG